MINFSIRVVAESQRFTESSCIMGPSPTLCYQVDLVLLSLVSRPCGPCRRFDFMERGGRR